MSLSKRRKTVVTFRLSPIAKQHINEIWLYGLSNWGEVAADRYYRGLFLTFESIAKMPLHYQTVDEIRLGYRRCPYKSHSIYYQVKDSEVQIMAVLGRQNLDQLLVST